MKKTRQLVTLGLLATGLVAPYGCSSDAMQEEDGGNNNGNIQPVELKIQTSVEMARAAATGTEGVVEGDAFAEGDKIAVFSDKNANIKAEYTLGNTANSWTVTSTDHIYLTGETANIYAVYPSTLTLTSGTTVGTNGTVDITSLFAGESSADNNNTITLPGSNPEKEINAAKGEKDYMYATATASATSSTASLTMKHALAMVTFKFYKD
ncbi:fimbrillin family protein, partial [Phocaeicola sp.]